MSDSQQEDLDRNLRESVGQAPWSMLETHAKRGGLLFVSTRLDLVEVAVAIAEDRSQAVAEWMGEGLLTRPTSEELMRNGAAPNTEWTFVIVQPYVLISKP